ncbi:hypothetical protein FKM82_027140 [Ascaphus truei]
MWRIVNEEMRAAEREKKKSRIFFPPIAGELLLLANFSWRRKLTKIAPKTAARWRARLSEFGYFSDWRDVGSRQPCGEIYK